MLKNRLLQAVMTVLLAALIGSYIHLSNKVDSEISIGINPWTGYAPFILADKKGLFEANNVSAKLNQYTSTEETIKAFKSGKIQAAGLTLDEAVSLQESGYPIKVVLVLDYSQGGDMVLGQKYITDMSMVKGKKVGYEGTLVGEFLLNRALAKNRIKSNAVELVQVKGEDWITAFRAGKVDVLVCYNPDAGVLIDTYGANVLFTSKDIPFEIIDVLVFDEAVYRNNKKSVIKIANAWFDAVSLVETDFDAAATIIADAKGISKEQYKSGYSEIITLSFEQNKASFDEHSEKNIYKYSQVIIDFMLDRGVISNRVNTDELFVQDILNGINR